MTEKEPRGPVLDIENMSRKQLLSRITLAQETQFGLDKATPAQLNLVYVLCRRWHLDPVTDLSLYRGRPWITLDGWARLIRRHPDWAGIKQRPLTKSEKEVWGYDVDDLVVCTTLLTKEHGPIEGYGKVTADERKTADKNTPLFRHPVEMAAKRSLARAARIAFGADVPDDEIIEAEMEAEMEVRQDKGRTAQLAARHAEIFDRADEWALPAAAAVEAEDESQEQADDTD